MPPFAALNQIRAGVVSVPGAMAGISLRRKVLFHETPDV
jgi:hypothetical protein